MVAALVSLAPSATSLFRSMLLSLKKRGSPFRALKLSRFASNSRILLREIAPRALMRTGEQERESRAGETAVNLSSRSLSLCAMVDRSMPPLVLNCISLLRAPFFTSVLLTSSVLGGKYSKEKKVSLASMAAWILSEILMVGEKVFSFFLSFCWGLCLFFFEKTGKVRERVASFFFLLLLLVFSFSLPPLPPWPPHTAPPR